MTELKMRPESDERVRLDRSMDLSTGLAKVCVQNASVLHVGCQKAQRRVGGLRPGDNVAIPKCTVGSRHQDVALLIQREGPDPSERFVVEVGQSDVQTEFVDV